MARWQTHDGTDAMPSKLKPTEVIEIESRGANGDGWAVYGIPAGLVCGWDEISRYRCTGQTVSNAYLAEASEARA